MENQTLTMTLQQKNHANVLAKIKLEEKSA